MKLTDLEQNIIVPIVDETKGGMTYEVQMTLSEFFSKALPDFTPEIVDAAPVVHSFWHWTPDGYVYCENCAFPLAKTKVNINGEERHLYLTTNYCSHCGAKMDKEVRT
jgi:hypothetical protein